MSESQRTLVLLKPDAVQRGLTGILISRLETKGLKIVAVKLLQMGNEMATLHYSAHVGKPFFSGLVDFITSGPLIALVVQGTESVDMVRAAMGSTNPLDAVPGTIRADLATDIGRNLVHGSDSVEAAEREIPIFFSDDEIVEYTRDVDSWIREP